MIQLLLAPYNDEEILRLSTLLGKMETLVQSNCERNDCCSECELKHLCEDIQRAKKFVENLRK
jgi:hypothetical protein